MSDEVDLAIVTMVFDASDPEALLPVLSTYVVMSRGHPACRNVDLPASVELAITDTEPGLQGDRVSGAKKPATLETGLVVQVPLFIEPGERIKVDTRTGEFISRA